MNPVVTGPGACKPGEAVVEFWTGNAWSRTPTTSRPIRDDLNLQWHGGRLCEISPVALSYFPIGRRDRYSDEGSQSASPRTAHDGRLLHRPRRTGLPGDAARISEFLRRPPRSQIPAGPGRGLCCTRPPASAGAMVRPGPLAGRTGGRATRGRLRRVSGPVTGEGRQGPFLHGRPPGISGTSPRPPGSPVRLCALQLALPGPRVRGRSGTGRAVGRNGSNLTRGSATAERLRRPPADRRPRDAAAN